MTERPGSAKERWGYKVYAYRGPPADGGKVLVCHVAWVVPGQERAYELITRLHSVARERADILVDDAHGSPLFFFDQLLPTFEIDGFPLLLTHVAVGGLRHPGLSVVARSSHYFVVHESAPNTDFIPPPQRSHLAWIGGDDCDYETVLKPALRALVKGVCANYRDPDVG